MKPSAAHEAASILEPIAILPSQLVPRIAHLPAPEMRLIAAVLEDAVNCIVSNAGAVTRERRREFFNAYDWVWEEQSDWPFAFVNVCDVLGLNATAVRERLRSFVGRRDAAG